MNIPANGQSSTVVIDCIVNMDVNAPDVCASTTHEIPVTAVGGNRV